MKQDKKGVNVVPEIFGIKFEYSQLHTLQYLKNNGILWNDDDFCFQSYREGNINHYERLFYRNGNQAEKPFTGLVYELYPDGSLLGYSYYVSGYKENDDTEFYPNGQIKTYTNFCKAKLKTLILEWYESGQINKITQLTNHSKSMIEIEYDEYGNIINQYKR